MMTLWRSEDEVSSSSDSLYQRERKELDEGESDRAKDREGSKVIYVDSGEIKEPASRRGVP